MEKENMELMTTLVKENLEKLVIHVLLKESVFSAPKYTS